MLSQSAIDILSALIFLSVKHTIADFFLQLPYQYKNKGLYGHPGGLLHALIHIICTTPVFLIIPPSSITIAGLILLVEFIAHYHIDWLKKNFVHWQNLHAKTEAFWYAIGIDQLAHNLTYIGIIAALLYY